jgi:CheY-like chemotaxis protein
MPTGGTLSVTSRNIALDSSYCRTSRFPLSPGDYIEIEIKDTGCGIPEELLDKIFDPFFTTKEQGKGTGLGLAALYGTVQQHKGAVYVSSTVDLGTRFQLLLPVGYENDVADKTRPDKKRGSGIILVVDDEEVMRLTAKAILEDLGYAVVLAENGQEALDIYMKRSGLFDAVVLDMIMPVMNGKDCFKKLIEYDKDACIILSSGFTREGDLDGLRKMGLAGFIRKPYRSNELSQIIHRALTE